MSKNRKAAYDFLEDMSRKLAKARAAAGPIPRRVRIHPLDLTKIPLVKDQAEITKLGGIPVVPDCAVRRGHPVADYEESDGA